MYHKSIGRVHWLILELDKLFLNRYECLYDYKYHNYCFYRRYCNGRSKRLKEVFLVIRTSKRCYRLMFYNHYCNLFIYETFRSARLCALRMMNLTKTFNN